MRIHRFTIALIVVALAACSKEEPKPPAATPAATTATPPAQPAPAAPAPAPAQPSRQGVFGVAELDQMVAPIALYPDSLLAQVLMAATYPGNVADAVAWSKAHPDAKGDDAVRQVAAQPWDPSVQSLVAFPQVMATLGMDPPWVQRLGDAFLAQPDDVMDAVQRLRRQAQAAGNLQSNEYQRVSEQPVAAAPEPAAAPATGGTVEQVQTTSSPTIIIEPSNPETVYVPSYNPTTVYGTWAYPSYPPAYYPPPSYYYPGSALVAGLAFGTGVAITSALWGDMDWGGGDVDIDVNNYNNINSNRSFEGNRNSWQHNSLHRDGVPYRDNASRERYGRQMEGSAGRDAFRGDDPARAADRERARQSMEQRGIQERGAGNRTASERAQAASRDVRDSQARDRARQTADRSQAQDRQRAQAQGARDRAQAQDRQRAQAAQGSRDRSQQDRQRAQAGQRQQAGQGSRDRAQSHQQRSQNNTQSRDAARRQQASRQGPHNNAFAGAHNPSQSRAQADRGRSSHASASRPSGSRGGGGHQVQRQSRPPQRSGGGHRR